jgi:hypothetical protein
MSEQLRPRFWFETVLAAASGALFLITLVWPAWIESAFGVDPDHASGSLEWAIVGVAFALALAFAVMARREWARRGAVAA